MCGIYFWFLFKREQASTYGLLCEGLLLSRLIPSCQQQLTKTHINMMNKKTLIKKTMEMMRLMLIYLITGDKEGNAGDYDEDDRGQEGLAHVEGQLPLRFQMETLPNRSY